MTLLDINKIAEDIFGELAKNLSSKDDWKHVENASAQSLIPLWMRDRLAKISEKTDIAVLEQQELTILAHILHAWPEYERLLPTSFCKKLQQHGKLEPLERAAVIITAYDYGVKNASTEARIRYRLEILAAVLQGGQP
jgi:hypothetical protein